MDKKKQKEFAKLLYLKDNCTLKEIAIRVDVSEKTIQRWAADGKWSDLRTSYIITKEEELRRLYNQIRELNDHIEGKPVGFRYADSKQADALLKLTQAIRSLETDTSIAQTVDVAKDILEFVRITDLDKAKELTQIFDAFIKNKMK